MPDGIYLRAKTFQMEWNDRYPGMPGRLGVCTILDSEWIQEEGDVPRCDTVWKKLRRKDESSLRLRE